MSPSVSSQNRIGTTTPPSLEPNLTLMLDKFNDSETPGAEVEQDKYDNDNDDDDDDGGGHGFELASESDNDNEDNNITPITKSSGGRNSDSIPSTDDSKTKSNKKRKSILTKKKSSGEDTSVDNTSVPDKKKKRQKKVRIVTNSDAMGYPAGNRNYKTVPLSEFENDEEDNNGRRRSKRRKIPPLAFWKNERLIYEANNATGVLAEVYGAMPLVSGVLTAEPTPYKKRKATVRTKQDSEDEDSEDDSKIKGKTSEQKRKKKVAETERTLKPFDSSKLRKVC
jgi:hypothetical protein